MRGVYDTPNTTIYNDDNNIDKDNNSNSNSDNNTDDDVDNDDDDNDDDDNDNDDDDDDAADGESYSASEDAVERHLSKVMQIHSVHRKKRASNTIAPDHDNNQRTRKRKLQPTFSETGTFKRLTANNRTAVVVIDNKETRVPVMRIKPKCL